MALSPTKLRLKGSIRLFAGFPVKGFLKKLTVVFLARGPFRD